jgi:hypothetical protein
MVAPIVGSVMLVGGSKHGQLDAAFSELSQSVGLGGVPPSTLSSAPACASVSGHSRAFSFGASTRDMHGPTPTAPTWTAVSGASGTYAHLPIGQAFHNPGAPQFSPHPQFTVAEVGGWIATGMGFGSSVIPARANYELPVVASTIAGTSMYGVYAVTDDGLGGDVLDCGSPASAGVSESNCYSAYSLGSSSDTVIVSTPPLHYVPGEEYPDAFEADRFVYSSPGQHDSELPVASVVGFSSPSHDAATGWAHPSEFPEHETASFSSCYESHCSSPDSTEAAAVCCDSQLAAVQL